MSRAEDLLVARLLADPTAIEARCWLQRDDGVIRTLGQSDSTPAAAALVARMYAAGAICVTVAEVKQHKRETLETTAVYENSGHLVIELPAEPKPRARVFRIQGQLARGLGFDATADVGQRHLYCMLD
jgi:hypothetical protein